ncbi:unnamed protein product [Owenia fusiformis]|uniref:BRCT domain-containing protein n=1 Tax=Owenia fusiformis TaxID=6347 RepID=A0A8J1UU92_OWEFU|nr:unnamed protein product [Owenia fusiformis]
MERHNNELASFLENANSQTLGKAQTIEELIAGGDSDTTESLSVKSDPDMDEPVDLGTEEQKDILESNNADGTEAPLSLESHYRVKVPEKEDIQFSQAVANKPAAQIEEDSDPRIRQSRVKTTYSKSLKRRNLSSTVRKKLRENKLDDEDDDDTVEHIDATVTNCAPEVKEKVDNWLNTSANEELLDGNQNNTELPGEVEGAQKNRFFKSKNQVGSKISPSSLSILSRRDENISELSEEPERSHVFSASTIEYSFDQNNTKSSKSNKKAKFGDTKITKARRQNEVPEVTTCKVVPKSKSAPTVEAEIDPYTFQFSQRTPKAKSKKVRKSKRNTAKGKAAVVQSVVMPKLDESSKVLVGDKNITSLETVDEEMTEPCNIIEDTPDVTPNLKSKLFNVPDLKSSKSTSETISKPNETNLSNPKNNSHHQYENTVKQKPKSSRKKLPKKSSPAPSVPDTMEKDNLIAKISEAEEFDLEMLSQGKEYLGKGMSELQDDIEVEPDNVDITVVAETPYIPSKLDQLKFQAKKNNNQFNNQLVNKLETSEKLDQIVDVIKNLTNEIKIQKCNPKIAESLQTSLLDVVDAMKIDIAASVVATTKVTNLGESNHSITRNEAQEWFSLKQMKKDFCKKAKTKTLVYANTKPHNARPDAPKPTISKVIPSKRDIHVDTPESNTMEVDIEENSSEKYLSNGVPKPSVTVVHREDEDSDQSIDLAVSQIQALNNCNAAYSASEDDSDNDNDTAWNDSDHAENDGVQGTNVVKGECDIMDDKEVRGENDFTREIDAGGDDNEIIRQDGALGAKSPPSVVPEQKTVIPKVNDCELNISTIETPKIKKSNRKTFCLGGSPIKRAPKFDSQTLDIDDQIVMDQITVNVQNENNGAMIETTETTQSQPYKDRQVNDHLIIEDTETSQGKSSKLFKSKKLNVQTTKQATSTLPGMLSSPTPSSLEEESQASVSLLQKPAPIKSSDVIIEGTNQDKQNIKDSQNIENMDEQNELKADQPKCAIQKWKEVEITTLFDDDSTQPSCESNMENDDLSSAERDNDIHKAPVSVKTPTHPNSHAISKRSATQNSSELRNISHNETTGQDDDITHDDDVIYSDDANKDDEAESDDDEMNKVLKQINKQRKEARQSLNHHNKKRVDRSFKRVKKLNSSSEDESSIDKVANEITKNKEKGFSKRTERDETDRSSDENIQDKSIKAKILPNRPPIGRSSDGVKSRKRTPDKPTKEMDASDSSSDEDTPRLTKRKAKTTRGLAARRRKRKIVSSDSSQMPLSTQEYDTNKSIQDSTINKSHDESNDNEPKLSQENIIKSQSEKHEESKPEKINDKLAAIESICKEVLENSQDSDTDATCDKIDDDTNVVPPTPPCEIPTNISHDMDKFKKPKTPEKSSEVSDVDEESVASALSQELLKSPFLMKSSNITRSGGPNEYPKTTDNAENANVPLDSENPFPTDTKLNPKAVKVKLEKQQDKDPNVIFAIPTTPNHPIEVEDRDVDSTQERRKVQENIAKMVKECTPKAKETSASSRRLPSKKRRGKTDGDATTNAVKQVKDKIAEDLFGGDEEITRKSSKTNGHGFSEESEYHDALDEMDDLLPVNNTPRTINISDDSDEDMFSSPLASSPVTPSLISVTPSPIEPSPMEPSPIQTTLSQYQTTNQRSQKCKIEVNSRKLNEGVDDNNKVDDNNDDNVDVNDIDDDQDEITNPQGTIDISASLDSKPSNKKNKPNSEHTIDITETVGETEDKTSDESAEKLETLQDMFNSPMELENCISQHKDDASKPGLNKKSSQKMQNSTRENNPPYSLDNEPDIIPESEDFIRGTPSQAKKTPCLYPNKTTPRPLESVSHLNTPKAATKAMTPEQRSAHLRKAFQAKYEKQKASAEAVLSPLNDNQNVTPNRARYIAHNQSVAKVLHKAESTESEMKSTNVKLLKTAPTSSVKNTTESEKTNLSKVESTFNPDGATVKARSDNETEGVEKATTTGSADYSKVLRNKWNVPVPSKWIFVTTGLSKQEMMHVQKLCKLLKCRWKPRFDKTTTHVIVKTVSPESLECERTLKYFQGIANQCWVMSYTWILDCLKNSRVLTLENYEIVGDVVGGSDHSGPCRSRLAEIPLLNNYEICCYGDYTGLTKDDLKDMLAACGATTVDDPDDFVVEAGCTQVILAETANPTRVEPLYNSLYRKYGILVISREWILDSVGSFKVLPYDDYLLCNVQV